MRLNSHWSIISNYSIIKIFVFYKYFYHLLCWQSKTKYNIFFKSHKRKSSHFRILVFREISKTHPEIIFPSKLNKKPKAKRNTLILSYIRKLMCLLFVSLWIMNNYTYIETRFNGTFNNCYGGKKIRYHQNHGMITNCV